MNMKTLTLLMLLSLPLLADSFKVGKGAKWHQVGTNNLSACKLPIDPLAKPSTNAVNCLNCLKRTKF